jgi:hypothetical protein
MLIGFMDAIRLFELRSREQGVAPKATTRVLCKTVPALHPGIASKHHGPYVNRI